jgi:SAM-dependent methyltransferase
MSAHDHWQRVYQAKTAAELSWYAAHLQDSLRLIQDVAPFSARIIDVGGGASTLVDDLLDLGYRDLTVLDVSEAALAVTRARLGDREREVNWIAADVTDVILAKDRFDLWHDRAVFHFLVDAADRQAYVRQVGHSLVAGGHVVIGTFALTGPTQCSGLDVRRYDAQALAAEFGSGFTMTTHHEATHRTPAGTEQCFLFCVLRKG